MVEIFPNVCLWQRSLFSNLGGIDPEKLYRATLTGNEGHDSQGLPSKTENLKISIIK